MGKVLPRQISVPNAAAVIGEGKGASFPWPGLALRALRPGKVAWAAAERFLTHPPLLLILRQAVSHLL